MGITAESAARTRTIIETGLRAELDEDQRRVLAAEEVAPLDLSADGVLAAATARSGLTDFGPLDFTPRLGRLLAEVGRDTNMWRAAKADFVDRCVQTATLRLRVQAYLKAHPELHDNKVERPIIIVGLSRSGTTHVENLIAADPRLRHLPAYLGAEPVPVPGELPRVDGLDPRWARARARWEATAANRPLAAMHEHSPDHACGENELQVPDFASYDWEWRAHLPGWRDAYFAEDQTPHFAYARTLLQAIMVQKPSPARWLLKGNAHSEQLPALLRVYPDATIVMTHRDPIAILQSLLTMRGVILKRDQKAFDAAGVATYWVDRVERMLRAYLRDMGAVPASQRVDLKFPEIMADDIGAATTVLECARLPVGVDSLAAMRAYMDAHPRGKTGRVAYDLAGDFGLETDDLYRRFQFYFDAFPMPREVT